MSLKITTIEQIEDSKSEQPEVAMVPLGDGSFSYSMARKCGEAYKKIMAAHPQLQEVALFHGTGGLDDTPEARSYVRRWARFAGLNTMEAIESSKLDQASRELLLKCGAVQR